jgi:hypothetical protein
LIWELSWTCKRGPQRRGGKGAVRGVVRGSGRLSGVLIKSDSSEERSVYCQVAQFVYVFLYVSMFGGTVVSIMKTDCQEVSAQ